MLMQAVCINLELLILAQGSWPLVKINWGPSKQKPSDSWEMLNVGSCLPTNNPFVYPGRILLFRALWPALPFWESDLDLTLVSKDLRIQWINFLRQRNKPIQAKWTYIKAGLVCSLISQEEVRKVSTQMRKVWGQRERESTSTGRKERRDKKKEDRREKREGGKGL